MLTVVSCPLGHGVDVPPSKAQMDMEGGGEGGREREREREKCWRSEEGGFYVLGSRSGSRYA